MGRTKGMAHSSDSSSRSPSPPPHRRINKRMRARLIAHSGLLNDQDQQEQQLPLYHSREVTPVVGVKWSALKKCCLFVPPIVIFGLTILTTQISVYTFWTLYNHSIIAFIFANYMQIQICANIWAVVKGRKKNCPQYQLCRLGISSSWMAEYKNEYTEVTTAGKSFKKWKMCKKCEQYMPLRSIHCEDCGQCSLRNDHHCYMMGVCIGIANTRYFILCTWWMMVFGLWGCYTYLYMLGQFIFNHDGEVSRKYLHSVYEHFDRYTFRNRLNLLDSPFSFINEHLVALLAAHLVFALSFLACATGGIFFFMQLYYIRQGMGMREADSSINAAIRGDHFGTTFWNRLQFLVGRPFWAHVLIPPPLLHLLLPRLAEVVWEETYIHSIVTEPFKGNLSVKEGIYEQGKDHRSTSSTTHEQVDLCPEIF